MNSYRQTHAATTRGARPRPTTHPRRRQRDPNALTVTILTLAATTIALYDLCLLAINLH
jgi:hypothetical protein